MQSAKEAIAGIGNRSGQQTSEVDEVVRPAVTSEVIKPSRHEETTQAIDKEVHKHHYHSTVQPVAHSETLPEQHTHQVAPQVERVSQQNNPEEDRSRVKDELNAYRDTRTALPATESSSAAQVAGEHTHHHVHETVQPVIHKETIAREVVHTTVPIHEKHIAPSEHHGISTLPMKSMNEFKETSTNKSTSTTGGLPQALKSGSHSHEEYEGHPRPYNTKLMNEPAPVDIEPEKHLGMHDPKATGHSGSRTHGTGTN